jgi:serine/threonine protein kinase/tetratricopeptide (TPR) repeat protein
MDELTSVYVEDRDPVEVLAAEFVDRHRRGESPQIDEYIGQHPALADQIRDLFPIIARLENLKLAKEHVSDGRALTAMPRLTQLGSFRIIRELGRGGMGVVYEAEDCSLNRRVALKVLGANVAHSPAEMQRFRHESQAAARLYHQNIVSVFGTGEEHGVLFYAMQLIEGIPLSQLIEQLRAERIGLAGGGGDVAYNPSDKISVAAARHWRDWRTIAQTMCDLALGLAYAHSQRVLHRDIKPANIFVDHQGCVWIGDFGLAKFEDHQAVTNPGELVGTLRYMAPEQFHGECDARSDVYSLGLTFYELLTLQPGFPDSQHAKVMHQKTTTSVPSPRSIDNSIPIDLETIALKACALEPTHRYQSAADFADDLRCFFEDRPIRARHISVVESLWRWSRRNPLVAGLSGVAAVLLAAVAVVFAVGNYRTNRALDSAVVERRRAEGNLQLAVEALDEIMQKISERGIPQTLDFEIPGAESPLQNVMVTEADTALLQSLLHFYGEFAADNRAKLNSQYAAALQRIGGIQQRLGKLSEAETTSLQAAKIYGKLVDVDPREPQAILGLAAIWNQVGTVRSLRGNLADAVQAHVAALHVLQSSPALAASDAGKFRLAETYDLISSVASRVGGRELIFRMNASAEKGPTPPSERSERDQPEILGHAVRRPEFSPAADRPIPRPLFDRDEAIRQAVKLLQELLDRAPNNPAYQFALAKIYRNAIHLKRRGRTAGNEALNVRQAADNAIEILKSLVRRFPNSSVYRFELAATLCRAAQRIPDLDRGDRIAYLEEALQLTTQLAALYPQVHEYQALLASAERRLGEFAHLRGETAEAEQRYRRALELNHHLFEQFPTVSAYQIGYAQTLSECADVQRGSGQREAASAMLKTALGIAERFAATAPGDPMFRDFLANLREQQQEFQRDDANGIGAAARE